MAGVRDQVIELLKPLAPKAWVWIPFQTNLDVPAKPTVMLKLKSVERTQQVGRGSHTVDYVLTLIEPKTTPGAADDDLDDKLLDLLHAIDKVRNLTWTTAERATWNGENPCYDITIQTTSTPSKGTL